MTNFEKWILAARPKTLLVSFSPVLLGSAFAYHYGSFKLIPALICLIFALLAQITSNLVNDYFDYKKGADREDRLGPVRTVSAGLISPQKMMRGIILTISTALLTGLLLIHFGGWQLIFVGLLVAVFAFAYSGGPYPLSYHGLGDIAVLVFYGIVPVVFTYYVQALNFPIEVLIGSIGIGMVGINLLIVNNYRDMEADIISGKKTTVVRFGRKFMRMIYLFNCISAALLSVFFLKIYALAMIPFLLFSFILWRKLGILKGKELNKLLGMSSMNVLIYSITITLIFLFK